MPGTKLWVATALVLGVGLGFSQACASEPPRALAPSSVLGGKALEPSDVSAPAVAPAPSALRVDVEQFTPLLARDELKRASIALEQGEPLKAAALVSEVLKSEKLGAEAANAMQLLRARLCDAGGALAEAKAAYSAIQDPNYILYGYARAGLAKVLLASGEPKAALAVLEQVKREEPLQLVLAEISGDAAAATGQVEHALMQLRALLTRERLPRRFAKLALSYARLLIVRARGSSAPVASEQERDQLLALGLLRKARSEVDPDFVQIQELEGKLLGLFPAATRPLHAGLAIAEQLAILKSLVEKHKFKSAEVAAEELLSQLRGEQRFSSDGCEVQILRAKAWSGDRQWGRAVDSIGDLLRSCKDEEQKVRAVYLGGKSAFADKRYAMAAKLFATIESDYPKHTLADDARLYGALAQRELGAEDRYTEMLANMAEHYPIGDMTREGVFRLALRELERRSYASAAQVLSAGLEGRATLDAAENSYEAGRERYFLARALVALGEQQRGFDEYARVLADYPLSYYSLHSISQMHALDAGRTEQMLQTLGTSNGEDPLIFEYDLNFEAPGFLRALELLRVGDIDAASAEFAALGFDNNGAAPKLLWVVALLYQRAGAIHACHALVSKLRAGRIMRWPVGEWQKAWELLFPEPYAHTVKTESTKNSVDAALIYAVMREESAFNPEAVSIANAQGLMQLMPATARHYAKKTGIRLSPRGLFLPHVNIALGSKVLAEFGQQFPDNPLLVIPSYNAGPARPRRWLRELASTDFDLWVELIPYRETRNYTKRVLTSRATYAYLYGSRSLESLRLPLKVNLGPEAQASQN